MGLLFNLRHGRAVTPKRAQGTRTLPEAQADRARGVLDNEIDADRAQLMDVERLQNWETMGPHAERAAADSQAASSGQVHGAPRGVTDPAVTDGLAREYAEHIKAALDAGVNPDYFYADGRSAIAGISQPGQEVRNAGLYGFTSAQVGPHLNMNFTARALDQYNMAGPEAVNSTLYPNKARAPLNDIIHGLAPWQGWKRERYKNLLTPTNDAEMAMRRGDIDHRPPNDRHEGRAAGFEGQPTSAPQVAYTDTVRNRAIEFVNADLEAAGMPPLNQEQAQALHWIHRRAQAEGLPTEVTRADTVLGSAELQTVQHGWESMPGQTANHLPEVGSPGGMSPLELHDRYTGIALDPATGKDRFISGMGGELQLPAIHGGGYYNGQINPGTQSRSIGGSTQRGIDPHTAARVDGTEATRALMMGQDAAAYSNTRPLASTERLRDANAFEVKLPEGALSHEQLAAFAPDFEAHGAFLVPTPEGFRVMTGGSKFADPEGVARALDNIAPGQYQPAVTDGNYFELDWQGGNATRGMLERIDNPIAPALQQWADSPAMRQLAGDFADEFEALAARGLTRTISWRTPCASGGTRVCRACGSWSRKASPPRRRWPPSLA